MHSASTFPSGLVPCLSCTLYQDKSGGLDTEELTAAIAELRSNEERFCPSYPMPMCCPLLPVTKLYHHKEAGWEDLRECFTGLLEQGDEITFEEFQKAILDEREQDRVFHSPNPFCVQIWPRIPLVPIWIRSRAWTSVATLRSALGARAKETHWRRCRSLHLQR